MTMELMSNSEFKSKIGTILVNAQDYNGVTFYKVWAVKGKQYVELARLKKACRHEGGRKYVLPLESVQKEKEPEKWAYDEDVYRYGDIVKLRVFKDTVSGRTCLAYNTYNADKYGFVIWDGKPVHEMKRC